MTDHGTPFTDLIDLASERAGGSVILAKGAYTLEGGEKTKTDSAPAIVPNVFLTSRLTEMVGIGIGLHFPFGSSISWPDGHPQAEQLLAEIAKQLADPKAISEIGQTIRAATLDRKKRDGRIELADGRTLMREALIGEHLLGEGDRSLAVLRLVEVLRLLGAQHGGVAQQDVGVRRGGAWAARAAPRTCCWPARAA